MTEVRTAGAQRSAQDLTPSGGVPITGRKAVALVAVLLLGVLAFQLNASMVTPALPHMAVELGVSASQIAQVSSLFFLAGSVAGMVLARWADFIGRRRVLVIVLCVLALGTLLCLFASSLPVLLVGRVLQGASAATFQLAYVILSEAMAVKVFGVTLGIITAVNGGVGGIDGWVGGLLTDAYGYRSIFLVVLVVGLFGLVGVLAVVPKVDPPRSEKGSMDWAGAAALSVGLIGMTYFVSQGSALGWLSPVALTFLVVTAVALVVFWRLEKRHASPLIAVQHLRSRQVWPLIATTTLALAGIFAVINFSVVLLSQGGAPGFEMTASRSALVYLMPAALIGVVTAPLAGWLAGRFGWIKVLRVGMTISLVVLAVVATLTFNPWVVAAMVAILGVSYNGLVLTTVNGLGVLLSPREAPSALPGLNGASFGLGASIGIGVVAPFIARGTSAGYTTGLWISVGITALALVASWFIAPRPEADAPA
ncbi:MULTISPECIES: MFS transporter [Oerskovia]|uniref:MFS transporter n=1 Tax=Oerskovia paurometabola TaxID=162170 RepID=A0ABW1XDT8_9CELL|nr:MULTISPECIES: MFS transporter [Oerskovia]MBM7498825.1 putative MFS family arabinose efflux permease [Oerskovia paurometabola]